MSQTPKSINPVVFICVLLNREVTNKYGCIVNQMNLLSEQIFFHFSPISSVLRFCVFFKNILYWQ